MADGCLLTGGAVFGAVGGREKYLAADGTALLAAGREELQLQRLARRVFQQHVTEVPADYGAAQPLEHSMASPVSRSRQWQFLKLQQCFLIRLCDIYHVSTDYLLCRTDYRATESQSLSIEKYGFSERAAQNLKLVRMMELVAAKGKEQPLKSSALDLLCSSDQIGILCDYINQYRTLMQQTEYHIYDREMGAENVALTLKALPQRKEAELSLYCACETLKTIIRAGVRATRHDSEDAAQTGRK